MMTKELSASNVEADVQGTLRKHLGNSLGLIFETKYSSDGIGYSIKNKLRLICEFKYNVDLTKQLEVCKIIAQVVGYLKKNVDDDPTTVPQVAIGADIDEAFVVPVKDIINYTTMDYNWSLSPSKMYKDSTLMDDLLNDENIQNIFIFNLNNDFNNFINKIKIISKGVHVPRVLNEKNIDKVFNYFVKNISFTKDGKKINDNDLVNLFASIMLHPETAILGDIKGRGFLYTPLFKGPLSIGNLQKYKSFIGEFSRTYTSKQKHKFTGILDRLIQDTTRRNQGEFFTPTEWVNKAHEYLESVYGENWKDEYVVWDPAWGTGNLTRDFQFKELYVSTLNQSDIDTANQMGYNPEAKKFRYDFLSDDYDELPEGLRKRIEQGRKIIVLMNPPYGTAGNNKRDGVQKDGVSKNIVGERMNEDKMGFAARNLYLQFIYKLVKDFKNVDLAMFTPPTYISSESNKPIYDLIFDNMNFETGFIMDAANFADVKSWGLSFSILSRK
jgi:hypothetical protein